MQLKIAEYKMKRKYDPQAYDRYWGLKLVKENNNSGMWNRALGEKEVALLWKLTSQRSKE